MICRRWFEEQNALALPEWSLPAAFLHMHCCCHALNWLHWRASLHHASRALRYSNGIFHDKLLFLGFNNNFSGNIIWYGTKENCS
jgi:hypothetical protein